MQESRESCRIARSARWLGAGLPRLDQEVRVFGREQELDVSGRFCFLLLFTSAGHDPLH
jgi:hypothetical protein